jgi:riboflavin kinase / FMN adenylyltransferase
VVIAESRDQIPSIRGGSVIAMGDFDGLHTGHRVLIDETIRRASAAGLTSILVTYEPSPKKILKRLSVDKRLTTFAEKKALLAETKLDIVLFHPVTAETLRISALSFLRKFLIGQLRLRSLVMGGDHHFGHNRRGNAAYLRAAAPRYGFEPIIIGDTATAAFILGRPYCVSGIVMHGEARGAAIGFPTANLRSDPEKLLPATGVYAGTAQLASGERWPAVANLGHKPTAGEFPLGLEIHLLDFAGDLYGAALSFEFGIRLRPETRFADFQELREQIAREVIAARYYAEKTKKVSLI